MEYIIEKCTEGDAEYIIDRLVEYNLSQVSPEQITLLIRSTKRLPTIMEELSPVVLRECTVGMSPTLIRCG